MILACAERSGRLDWTDLASDERCQRLWAGWLVFLTGLSDPCVPAHLAALDDRSSRCSVVVIVRWVYARMKKRGCQALEPTFRWRSPANTTCEDTNKAPRVCLTWSFAADKGYRFYTRLAHVQVKKVRS